MKKNFPLISMLFLVCSIVYFLTGYNPTLDTNKSAIKTAQKARDEDVYPPNYHASQKNINAPTVSCNSSLDVSTLPTCTPPLTEAIYANIDFIRNPFPIIDDGLARHLIDQTGSIKKASPGDNDLVSLDLFPFEFLRNEFSVDEQAEQAILVEEELTDLGFLIISHLSSNSYMKIVAVTSYHNFKKLFSDPKKRVANFYWRVELSIRNDINDIAFNNGWTSTQGSVEMWIQSLTNDQATQLFGDAPNVVLPIKEQILQKGWTPVEKKVAFLNGAANSHIPYSSIDLSAYDDVSDDVYCAITLKATSPISDPKELQMSLSKSYYILTNELDYNGTLTLLASKDQLYSSFISDLAMLNVNWQVTCTPRYDLSLLAYLNGCQGSDINDWYASLSDTEKNKIFGSNKYVILEIPERN